MIGESEKMENSTKTAKAVNYTPEMEAQLREGYANGKDVAELATLVGKNVKSVVAKLVRMGVYKKKEYVSKTGAKPVKKEQVLDELAKLVDLTESELSSLAGANKTALQKLVQALA